MFHNFFLMTVYSYHVTYTFQSKSTLYSCLNVKELLARSWCKIWSLSDCNWTRTHNHLVHKWTFSHLVHKQTLNHLVVVGSSPVVLTYANAQNVSLIAVQFYHVLVLMSWNMKYFNFAIVSIPDKTIGLAFA